MAISPIENSPIEEQPEGGDLLLGWISRVT